MKLKTGVSIALSVPEMTSADAIVEGCYASLGVECIATSGDERASVHHGKPIAGDTEDPHYCGKARDYRIKNVAPEFRSVLVDMIREQLGPRYVVLWENRDKDGEHVHVQAGHIAVA